MSFLKRSRRRTVMTNRRFLLISQHLYATCSHNSEPVGLVSCLAVVTTVLEPEIASQTMAQIAYNSSPISLHLVSPFRTLLAYFHRRFLETHIVDDDFYIAQAHS